MAIETTDIFFFLHDNYIKRKDKTIFALEGSSGSGKTYSGIDFIIEYCKINAFKGKVLTIGRESYRDCCDTILADFIKRLKMIGAYQESKHYKSHPQRYDLLGNMIEFTGWSTNGQPSKRQDVLWFNEIFESDENIFKQYNQRTNEVVLCDWNPKVTEHWVFDKILPRKDCLYRHCKMIDNPFLPAGQKYELLAYESWLPGSYYVDENLIPIYNGKPIGSGNYPPPHPVNVANGTADMYMWMVYGLGLRMAPTGLIFSNVRYIPEFPDMDFHYFIDFGFTVDPCVIGKYSETSTDIYIEVLNYEPLETPEEIHEYSILAGVDIKKHTVADSADKHTSEKNGTIQMVRGLRKLGWNIHKVSKTKSVMFWLTSMKKKRINFIINDLIHHVKKEAQNYRMKEINGIPINQPIDKFNHIWDGARYAHMAENSSVKNFNVTEE